MVCEVSLRNIVVENFSAVLKGLKLCYLYIRFKTGTLKGYEHPINKPFNNV